MGKFLNTSRKDSMSNLVDGFKERLKNPYYLHNDKKATIVTYFNINKDKSTLDDGLKIEYSQITKDSPFRYNQIDDFYLYGGLEQMAVELEVGEFGLQSGQLNGNSIILPNTITPMPGDYFSIEYMDRPCLFEVTNVNVDTLESGANMYKIDFEYNKRDTSFIEPLVVERFKMVVDNTGTSLKCIIKKDVYDYISDVESICDKLKEYYQDMFFYSRVETFILHHLDGKFYDANLIEFLIRNKILEGRGDTYSHITQQISLPRTFSIDYDKTFFRMLENRYIKNCNNYAYGTIIEQPLSILSMNKEYYFSLSYVDKDQATLNQSMEIFNSDLLNRIKYNELYYIDNTSEDTKLFDGILRYVDENGKMSRVDKYKGSIKVISDLETFSGSVNIIDGENINKFNGSVNVSDGKLTNVFNGKILNIIPTFNTDTFKGKIYNDNSYNISVNKINNIIIKYFNGSDITKEDVDNLESLNYIDSLQLFYNIPIVIFILEQYIKKHLSKEG